MTKAGTIHTAIPHGTSAAGYSQLRYPAMGTNAKVPCQRSAMASKSAARHYRDSGWIPVSVDYVISSLGHITAPDLRMGRAFGQFYALDHKQPRL